MIPLAVTNSTVTFTIEGNTYHVPRTPDTFIPLMQALQNDDAEGALKFTDSRVLEVVTDGRVVFEDGVVKYKGTVVHDALTQIIQDIAASGLDYEPWIKLMENIYANPSPRAKKELYPFFAVKGLTITDDGCFLAYKVVIRKENGHLYDKHTRTILNDIGEKPRMRREDTDSWGIECGQGFHIGGPDYSSPTGSYFTEGSNDVVVIVKVNPRDVVSVPSNEGQKLRTCAYEVIREFAGVYKEPVVNTTPKRMPTVKQAMKRKSKTWKEIVSLVLGRSQPMELVAIYKAVRRFRDEQDAPHMKAKVRQTLQKIAKKKGQLWRLK